MVQTFGANIRLAFEMLTRLGLRWRAAVFSDKLSTKVYTPRLYPALQAVPNLEEVYSLYVDPVQLHGSLNT